MEKEQEKETVTNLQVTLGKERFKIFQAGIKAYHTGYIKPANEVRLIHYKIGRALNLIEIDLREAGVKQKERAKITSDNFDGITSQEKTNYRKFAKEYESMNDWCKKHYANGYNLDSIIKGFAKHERAKKECQNQADNFFNLDFTQFVEPEKEVFTKDKAGKVIPIEQKEVQEQELKKGFDLNQGIGKVTLEDLRNHFIRLSNEIEKQYRAGSFNTEETNQYLEDIETRLDALNLVLKDSKLMDSMFNKSDRKAA